MTEEEKKQSDINARVQEILSDENMPEVDKVRKLYELGFNRKQLMVEFNFSRATVYVALPVKGERTKAEAEGESEDKSKLPFVLKSGKGTEVITPEGIMQFYLLGDGDTGAAMLKGMMLLRAAQLMVMNDVEIMKGQAEAQAKAIQPILDVMEKAREDMDAAAERARASTEDVAQAAAAGAAARAAMHIDEKFEQLRQQKADIATVQDPMKGLMARTMETLMNRMTGTMLGGQVPPTPGLVDERVQK
jgi:hypothetical protein